VVETNRDRCDCAVGGYPTSADGAYAFAVSEERVVAAAQCRVSESVMDACGEVSGSPDARSAQIVRMYETNDAKPERAIPTEIPGFAPGEQREYHGDRCTDEEAAGRTP
jgi:hypothetical protein